MKKYVSVAEMVIIEKAADRVGHTYPMMMEAAGKGLADSILSAHSQIETKRVLALVGKGNNGGDALVALKHLVRAGWHAECFLISDLGESELLHTVKEIGCKIFLYENKDWRQELHKQIEKTEIIIDGLLGTGMSLPVREPFSEVMEAVNNKLKAMVSPPQVVAVDCPSGIDCDTGESDESSIKADLTVCMAAYKQGLLKFPANVYLGKVEIADIGIPDDLPEWRNISRYIPDQEDINELIPKRPADGHKSTFGTVLIAAGSISYPGAAWLAGNAAYRSGVGMVTMAVPESVHPILAKEFPEATWIVLSEVDGFFSEKGADKLLSGMGRATSMLVGPGFGTLETSREFIRNIIENIEPLPMIFDADGLRLLSGIEDWYRVIPKNSILTPHPGEMSEMTGLSIKEIQTDRVEIAEKYARKWGHVVVLKGAFTVIAQPSGETIIIPFASSALATAGTGDVLAGLVAGFVAQGMLPFEAAYLGAWIHAQAGMNAARIVGSSAGVIAGDLIVEIPKLLNIK